jgi:hypothetical protein
MDEQVYDGSTLRNALGYDLVNQDELRSLRDERGYDAGYDDGKDDGRDEAYEDTLFENEHFLRRGIEDRDWKLIEEFAQHARVHCRQHPQRVA